MKRVVRVSRGSLADGQLRFEQMIDWFRRAELSAEQRRDRAFGAVIVAGDERDRRFIDEIIVGQAIYFFEVVPELERLRLAGPRKKTRHGPDRLRFVRPKLVGCGRFLACIVPLLLIDERKRFPGMAPRLPCLYPMQNRPSAKHRSERDHDQRHDGNDPAFPFSFQEPQFFCGKHYVGGHGKGERLKAKIEGRE